MNDHSDRTEPHSVDLPTTHPHARRGDKPRVWHLFVLFLVAQGAILFSTVVAVGFAAAARWHAGPQRDAQQQAALFKELVLSPGLMLFSLASSVMICAGLGLLVGALSPRPFVERLRLGKGRLSVAEVTVASGGFLALSVGADAVLRFLPGYKDSGIVLIHQLFQGRTGTELWLMIALVGVAGPLGEELFYRGALQTRFAERFGRGIGLTVTSVAFALAHVEPIHMLFALAAGFYLGWISDLASSCRASLAAHAVNNTVAALGAVWRAPTEEVFTAAPVVAVASGLLVAGSTVWLWRRTRDRVGRAGP